MNPCPVRKTHEWDGDWCRACYMARPPNATEPRKTDWATWSEDFVKQYHWIALYRMTQMHAADEMTAPSYRRASCPPGTLLRIEAPEKIYITNQCEIRWPPARENWGTPSFFAFFAQPAGGAPVRINPLFGAGFILAGANPSFLRAQMNIEEQ